jgi:glucosamine--fructose-6-phosphate aminotransferase (isomerizing)
MRDPENPSILENEIFEQPQVIERLLNNEIRNVREIAASLKGAFEYVVIAARGTSDNAARYAQYLFGGYNRLSVALATPSLFTLYRQPPKLNNALVIGISQSGQSPDIVEVINEGNRQGRPTLAITNAETSPLAKAARYTIHLHAGTERAVAATKTYTSSLAALALLSSCLDSDHQRVDALQQLPDDMQKTLRSLAPSLARVERYRYMSRCTVIGRGYNYATAFEVALKIKELTRTTAEPYSSADFRHGPIAMVRDGFPVLVIAPSGDVYGDVDDLVQDLRRRDSELLLISDNVGLLEQANLPLPIPSGISEWLSPMTAVLPGQLFSLALARSKGLNPDQPQGIQKVTETL